MSVRNALRLFGALMLVAALLAHAMKPAIVLHPGNMAMRLEALVPVRFATWHVDSAAVPVALPTALEAQQNELYDQLLVRTYVNPAGEHIMLTIAYGGSQNVDLQVHRPEVCYAALGFTILDQRKIGLAGVADGGAIPAMRLVAAQRARNEPVTYWIRFGDQVVRGNLELGFARLAYGLRGYIADGLLFRVSNVTSSNEQGFALQRKFIGDLFAALDMEGRRVLIGGLAAAQR